MNLLMVSVNYFFFNDTATTEIYTLSLHDALPILLPVLRAEPAGAAPPGVPHPGPPGSAVAGRHERVEQRAHGVFELQHPEGQPAARGGGDAPAAAAVRAPLRAPGVGGTAAHIHPVEVHPAVLRRRGGCAPPGAVSPQSPPVLSGGAG